MLPPSMPLEDKKDELGEIPVEDLQALLVLFTEDEDYDICQAIKEILGEKNNPSAG